MSTTKRGLWFLLLALGVLLLGLGITSAGDGESTGASQALGLLFLGLFIAGGGMVIRGLLFRR